MAISNTKAVVQSRRRMAGTCFKKIFGTTRGLVAIRGARVSQNSAWATRPIGVFRWACAE
jgi:hypothetical protein